MCQQRLGVLALLCVEKDLSSEIFPTRELIIFLLPKQENRLFISYDKGHM